MSPVVFGLEWRRSLARRRTVVLSVLVPVAVVLPMATGALSAGHAATGYTLLFGLACLVGSARSLLQDAATGVVARILRGGVAPSSYLLQRSLASAVLDTLELTPALFVVAAAVGASGAELLFAYAALAATAWIGCLLGAVVASLSRSPAEMAVLVAVAALLLFHMSGVFNAPTPGTLAASLEGAAPFRALHEALLGMVTGTPVRGGGAAAAWTLALPMLVATVASRLLDALDQVRWTPRAGVA